MALQAESGRVDNDMVFVGGPLQFLGSHENSRHIIEEHRGVIKHLRDAGRTVVSAHEEEDYGVSSHMFDPESVTARDFEWTHNCSIYIAFLPVDDDRVPYRTDGTHVEIGWATAMGKRVILMLDDSPSVPYSHLVYGLGKTGHARIVSIANWRNELMTVLEKLEPRA